ncbi:MAG TPA: hypothetical protein PLK77_01135 [Pyrinomonadaceae bacterium]|nr:hypothetical protein [Pyrinomonadaceae bacterium]
MLKLYKYTDDQLHYWETWEQDEKAAIIHWGVVGEKGQKETIRSGILSPFHNKVQKLVDQKIEDGYRPIDDDELFTLLIEYAIEGMGTPEDLDKRHKLEDRMNETLGWTGLGHCDGGSIGSGTMEVCCFVVDFEIAKQVIEKDLAGTEFENYTRIFDENAG